MAVNVLVIPEDFRKDQYVLKPIVEKMFAGLSVTAKVRVCCDPLLGGVGEAMKRERINEIVERYRGMIHVFLLIVDRDCDANRRARLDSLEAHTTASVAGRKPIFLAQEAWQEIEVWVLAGLKSLPKKWVWKDVRAHCDPKEHFFDVVARERGLWSAPYQGRVALAREAAANYGRIRQLCPEDVGALEERIRSVLRSLQ